MRSGMMLGALAGAAMIVAGALPAGAQTSLRYAYYSGSEGIRPDGLKWFAEEVKSRTDGRYDIQFHWAGSLLGAKDIYAGVRDGVADMGIASAIYVPQDLYPATVADLPQFPTDFYAGPRALLDFLRNDEVASQFMEDAGIVPVSIFPSGPFQLLCKGEISSLSDLDGKKIRGVASMTDVIEQLGGSLVSVPITESFQALDSGLIDCTSTFDVSIRAYRQHEVADHYLVIDYGQYIGNILAMNKDVFDSMSDEDQQTMLQLGADFLDYYSSTISKESEDIRALMREGEEGPEVIFVEISDEERQQLLDMSAGYTGQWLSKANDVGVQDPQGLLDRWLKFREKSAADLEANGYPWE